MDKEDSRLPIIASPETGRVAGWLLLIAAVLSILAMAHHPSGIDHGSVGGSMALGGLVHATMIVLLAVNLWGLTIFSIRQGIDGWILAGILSYGLSLLGNVIAALINGFIVPSVATVLDHAESGNLFVLLWESNQAAARLAVYSASVAFVVWSVFLIRRKTLEDLVLGCVGLIAGVAPGAALYTGTITLDVDGAFVAYGAQAVWTGLIGLQMTRRRL